MSPAAASPLAIPMFARGGRGLVGAPGLGVGVGPDWSFFHDHEPIFFMPDFGHAKFGAAAAAAAGAGSNSAQAKGMGTGTGAAADVAHKIVKQVEYHQRINTVANEFLLKIVNNASSSSFLT